MKCDQVLASSNHQLPIIIHPPRSNVQIAENGSPVTDSHIMFRRGYQLGNKFRNRDVVQSVIQRTF